MGNRVAGKKALVTGGAQGLGAATCKLLAAEGAQVLVTDVNEAGATETAAAINAEHGSASAFAVKLDVTSGEEWDAAIDAAVGHMGGLSVLVNNAGIGVPGDIMTCTLEDWHRGFAVNVDSVFLGSQKALAVMKDHQPGSIINISSIAGLIASDSMPGYNASKAAVWMLSKSVALYCAKQRWNIRCNSVHPTFIDTPILDGIGKNANMPRDVVMMKLARQVPMGRIGEPIDVANGVLYLASDESKYMTGSELKLDGGISAM